MTTAPTVLITGATRGIGLACAARFARGGYRVTGVARTTGSDGEWLTASGVALIEADLSAPEGIAKVPHRAYDVVILNAATYTPGGMLDAEDAFEDLLPLNVLANHRLARRLLPKMIERKKGHLIVIGSTGTDSWPQHMTAYVATKYALRGLFRAWEIELTGMGVLSTLISPGATLTSSWDGEEPPADILLPATVAQAVWRAVEGGDTGRLTILP